MIPPFAMQRETKKQIKIIIFTLNNVDFKIVNQLMKTSTNFLKKFFLVYSEKSLVSKGFFIIIRNIDEL